MNSLELAVLEPYENGILKPHTVGILRDIEEQNTQYEVEDTFERKELRRSLEIRLIKKFDKTKINARRECWYLIDTLWLNAWAEWVENIDGAEPPGKLSTAGLRDEEGNILKGLRPKIDYRGVPPTVYYIYKELYGKDDTPPICRYTVDIYNMPVPDEHMVSINRDPQLKARVVVNKIREKYVKWGEDEEDEEDEWCCCGLTRDHVESILYWILTCGSRTRSGRKNIRYRDYRPLKRTVGDDTMSEWSVRSNSTLASIESDHTRVSNTSIGDADRGYGQNSIVRNWVMGMMGYTSH